MGLIDFIQSHIPFAYGVEISAIALGIIWIIVYDFYHVLFSSILTWFKKK